MWGILVKYLIGGIITLVLINLLPAKEIRNKLSLYDKSMMFLVWPLSLFTCIGLFLIYSFYDERN